MKNPRLTLLLLIDHYQKNYDLTLSQALREITNDLHTVAHNPTLKRSPK